MSAFRTAETTKLVEQWERDVNEFLSATQRMLVASDWRQADQWAAEVSRLAPQAARAKLALRELRYREQTLNAAPMAIRATVRRDGGVARFGHASMRSRRVGLRAVRVDRWARKDARGGDVSALAEVESAVALVVEHRFPWCRARLLHALAAAEEQGVLGCVLDELLGVTDPDHGAHEKIRDALWRTGWMGEGPTGT